MRQLIQTYDWAISWIVFALCIIGRLYEVLDDRTLAIIGSVLWGASDAREQYQKRRTKGDE